MGDPVSNNPELAQAIKDAAAAVDARTGKASEPAAAGIEVEVQASKPAEPSPVDAYSAAKKQLEEALAQAKKDSSDLKDRWMRAAADLENYKKRAAKEREEVVKFGNERLLKDLLPVLDDLDRTVQAGTAAAATAESAALQTFLEGARLTQKKFLTQLEKSGVEGFEVVGKPFDPTSTRPCSRSPPTCRPAAWPSRSAAASSSTDASCGRPSSPCPSDRRARRGAA